MKIYINGKAEELKAGATVADAVRSAGIADRRGVAVAVDDNVVPAAYWEDVILSEGKRVEILRAVQGGAG